MAVYTPANSTELAAIVTANGDTIMLRSGVTYSAASAPVALLDVDNLTIGVSGTGNLPIISGGTVRTDWSYDATNNVYSRPAYAGNTLGNVTEDGVPMRFVPWNTNISTTVAQGGDTPMSTGQNLPYWSGSMTYDPVGKILYIRPSSGTASQHEYVVSEVLNGFYSGATRKNLSIDGVNFKHLSRHGIDLKNRTGVQIRNCEFNVIGGVKPASVWMGNGIELSKGVWGAETTDCTFRHIFDSCVTSQLYETSAASLGSHLWARLNCIGYRMAAVEVSAHTTDQMLTDIEIADIVSVGQARGWAYYNSGAVITNIITPSTANTSRILRSFARNVSGTNQNRLYLGFKHAGLCGIEDSVGVGTSLQAPRSDQDTRADSQIDLIRNVTDDKGAPIGANWVASTARMSNTFGGALL